MSTVILYIPPKFSTLTIADLRGPCIARSTTPCTQAITAKQLNAFDALDLFHNHTLPVPDPSAISRLLKLAHLLLCPEHKYQANVIAHKWREDIQRDWDDRIIQSLRKRAEAAELLLRCERSGAMKKLERLHDLEVRVNEYEKRLTQAAVEVDFLREENGEINRAKVDVAAKLAAAEIRISGLEKTVDERF